MPTTTSLESYIGSIASVTRGETVKDAELLELRKGVEEDEIYCHYIDHDRRNDEWVPISRIHFIEEEAETSNNYASKHKRRLEMASEGADGFGHQHHRGTATTGHHAVMDPSLFALLEEERHSLTKIKNIPTIQLGRWEIEAWYYSPYPKFVFGHTLYICEYTLKYTKSRNSWIKHRKECKERSPPGEHIYNDGKLSLWEVDGNKQQVYCQNLCLLSKLFLDHKTLYYDTKPFLFYVLTEYYVDPVTGGGHQIIGYFSKEKESELDYNLACILTFPPFQRLGYGKLLISFSYELSKREFKVGSPEKPLSDLGKLSYRSYWTFVLLSLLVKYEGQATIQDLSSSTGIKLEDVISTLQALDLVKYWKGQYMIMVSRESLSGHLHKLKPPKACDTTKLTWQPHTV